MLIPAYDEAVAVLEAADPSSSKVRECLDRVRSQGAAYKRRQKLHKEMAAATELLRNHRLEEAATYLEELRAQFPESQEIFHLLAYARKEQAALARATAIDAADEARSRAGSNELDKVSHAPDGVPQKKSIARPAPLFTAGIAAVIMAGGIVALRNRRPMDVATNLTTQVPRPAFSPEVPPDFAPPAVVTPTIAHRPLDSEQKVASTAPAREARLKIAGAAAGAQVKVDGQLVGQTDGSGTLQSELPPGTHTVELSKDGTRPRR